MFLCFSPRDEIRARAPTILADFVRSEKSSRDYTSIFGNANVVCLVFLPASASATGVAVALAVILRSSTASARRLLRPAGGSFGGRGVAGGVGGIRAGFIDEEVFDEVVARLFLEFAFLGLVVVVVLVVVFDSGVFCGVFVRDGSRRAVVIRFARFRGGFFRRGVLGVLCLSLGAGAGASFSILELLTKLVHLV